MIIDCISDTHGFFPQLEGGDLLIVAGDLTANDTHQEMLAFVHWTIHQKYRTVVYIAGNHDNCLVGVPSLHQGPNWDTGNPNCAYLCDAGITFEYDKTIEGHETTQTLKIWGSPWTPLFKGVNPLCQAFMLPEADLEAKFSIIPEDVDILVTHGPPWGVLDRAYRASGAIEHVGSRSLYNQLYSERIKPKLHVFGHIHEDYGTTTMLDMPGVQFVNCSHVNESYKPVNKPVRIIL